MYTSRFKNTMQKEYTFIEKFVYYNFSVSKFVENNFKKVYLT